MHYKDDFDDVIEGKGEFSSSISEIICSSIDCSRSRNYYLTRWSSRCWKNVDCGIRSNPLSEIEVYLIGSTVAENLRAPLYYMTAGELSLDASSLEQSLSDILERCTKWNAVLLLDEADVFLEQRSSTHLERNKLVSSKSLFSEHEIITDNTSLPSAIGILSRHALPYYQSSVGI
jgi:hypothetical protein